MGCKGSIRDFAGIYRGQVLKLQGTDRTVMLHVLLNCNYKDNPEFCLRSGTPLPLKRGQWVTSLAGFARDAGLTVDRIRCSLERLKKHGILHKEKPNGLSKQATLISLVEPDLFLHRNDEKTEEAPKESQKIPDGLPTNKNDKKKRNKEETTHEDRLCGKKSDFQKIYVAGSSAFPPLATANTSVIKKWLSEGVDAGQDAIPEIERQAKAGKPVKSWNYFTGGIMDAKATRETPLPQGIPKKQSTQVDEHVKWYEDESAGV